jgi:uncharacterized protein (DUF849 family)/ribosomal protein S18 acetylase RimI-like enzyme
VSAAIERMKACLNGGRSREDHPAVPLTTAELAASAAAAVEAGAEAVHLHPRGADERESLGPADIAAAVTAVRQACPATPVGVSTGLWITGGDPAARRSAVAAWTGLPAAARPDFASVNLSEPGWAELCGPLQVAGIAAEAGIWSVADADRLVTAGLAVNWLRILVEISDVPAETAVAAADDVLRRLDELDVTAPRLLHGEGPSCWPLIAHAGTLGLPTRIGLEDTTLGPDGSAVTGNPELVRLALRIWNGSASQVTLEEITEENREAVLALRVAPGQERFVSSVADSLAEAAAYPHARPWYRAVYARGEPAGPVGFVMVSWNVPPQPPEIIGPWFLWKLLIDERYQGRGYGTAVVRHIADLVRAEGATELLTSYVPEDGGPAGFYQRLGFVPTGELDDQGEVIVRLGWPSA